MTIRTAILETRFLTGDQPLYDELVERFEQAELQMADVAKIAVMPRVRDAVLRHLEKDLGPMALPRIDTYYLRHPRLAALLPGRWFEPYIRTISIPRRLRRSISDLVGDGVIRV